MKEQDIDEVYNMSMNIDKQFSEHRAYYIEKKYYV